MQFEEKFKTKELKIIESKYWIWSLRPNQVTLGSTIISLKRECNSFSELNHNEINEYSKLLH